MVAYKVCTKILEQRRTAAINFYRISNGWCPVASANEYFHLPPKKENFIKPGFFCLFSGLLPPCFLSAPTLKRWWAHSGPSQSPPKHILTACWTHITSIGKAYKKQGECINWTTFVTFYPWFHISARATAVITFAHAFFTPFSLSTRRRSAAGHSAVNWRHS